MPPPLSSLKRPPLQPIRRYISSKSAKTSKCSRPPLPPDKMRALISLYHQSDSFITIENLSERIDRAFLNNDPLARFMTPNASLTDLKHVVEERRRAPRMGAWDDRSSSFPYHLEHTNAAWSDRNSSREQSVVEALYGVDRGGKPGLGVLEETRERIEQNILEDERMAAENKL